MSPIASRSTLERSSSAIAAPSDDGSCSTLRLRRSAADSDAGIDRDGLGEPQVAFEPVEPRGHDRAEGQVRVGRAVDRFDLQVRLGAAVPPHTGDEPQAGLAVLQPPTRPRPRPAMRLQPEVADDRGARDPHDRRQRREDARREGLRLACHPLGPVPAVEHVASPAVPQAEMQVVPVADAPGEHHRSERDRHPVRSRHRPDGVAQDETRVRERDPRPVWHRQLELAGRVLGMELHHTGPLGLERPDQVTREGLVVGEHGCAVPGPLVRRDRIRLVGFAGPRPPPEEELELVGAAQLQPLVLQPVQHPARERPAARRPRVALLVPLVDRRHRPARRARQGDRRGGIGDQARVARRPLDAGGRGQVVVDQEHREGGRQAHAEPGHLFEAPQGDDLHARDAVGSDHGERDLLDPRGAEPPGHRRRRRCGRRPRSCRRRLAGPR